MTLEDFELTAQFRASPEEIFDRWLDGAGHTSMTGALATGKPKVGAKFSAWDGYIRGTNLVLERPSLIVQAWRTSQFSSRDPDSRLEIELTAEEGGTRLVLRHRGLPEGQGASYLQGWEEFYFAPMRRLFGE